MKRLLFSLFLTGIAALFLTSCYNNRVFDNYKSIPTSGWKKDSSVIFSFDIASTSQQYNLYLNVRYRTGYKYSNLWLIVEITAPDGTTKEDIVEITLADSTGKWLGEGFGGLKTIVNIFHRGDTFDKTGVYTVKIQQSMSEDNLKDINDIGFMVEKIE